MDILRVHLIERAESLARVVAGVGQPILRFFRSIEQTLERNLGADLASKPQDQEQSAKTTSLAHFQRLHFAPTLSR